MLEENKVAKTPEDIERFFKFQGVNAVADFLNNNPKMASFVYEKIKELH